MDTTKNSETPKQRKEILIHQHGRGLNLEPTTCQTGMVTDPQCGSSLVLLFASGRVREFGLILF